MCGFAGVYNLGNGYSTIGEVVTCMRDVLSHRGPDGKDNWISQDYRVAFGHRRLSFLDLSESARQPMQNEDGRVVIVFNGEIYNHALLRPVLEDCGHIFRTDHSDTEVLIHGFEQWGIDGLLSRISGDFAFAIYVQDEESVYFARDRAGVKPLYFGLFDSEFIFASEIKAILHHPSVTRDIDPIAMNHYLSFMATPAPMTMFKGISKLPAGTWLKLGKDGSVSHKQYYSAVPGKGIDKSLTNGLSEKALEKFYVEGIQSRLREAVLKRMVSDVPIGVFLSGGVDSTTNLAMMSESSTAPIETFTVGFKDYTDLNELEFARQAAQHFGAKYHEVLIDESDMIKYLDMLVYSQDEPLADWVCIPLHFVSKIAHEAGVKGVQVGEGADEQFCGYASYMDYLKLYHRYFENFRKWMPSSVKHALGRSVVHAFGSDPRYTVYADIIDRAARNREHFWTGAMVFWNAQKEHIVHSKTIMENRSVSYAESIGLMPSSYGSTDSYNIIEHFLSEFDAQFPCQDALTRMIHNEMRLRLPELLLMRVDKITMSHSLEARVPYLDHDLVDFTFDIPEVWKTKRGMPKYLLKKAVEGIIPQNLIYRKKMGFAAPMADWLRGEFGRVAISRILGSNLLKRGYINHKYVQQLYDVHISARSNCSKQLWALYNLVAWYDFWIDGPLQNMSNSES